MAYINGNKVFYFPIQASTGTGGLTGNSTAQIKDNVLYLTGNSTAQIKDNVLYLTGNSTAQIKDNILYLFNI